MGRDEFTGANKGGNLSPRAPFMLRHNRCGLLPLFGFDVGTELPPSGRLWAIYFILGTAFPMAALTAMSGSTPERTRFALAAIGTFLIFCFVLQTRHYAALSLGVIALFLAWPLIRSTWRSETRRGWVAWTLGVVLIGSWTIEAASPWDTPLEMVMSGRAPSYTIGYAAAIAVVLATIWGTISLASKRTYHSRNLIRLFDAAALVFFTIAAFRSDLNFAGEGTYILKRYSLKT